MVVALISSLIGVLICALIHYEVLTRTSRLVRIGIGGPSSRGTFLLLMTAVFAAHIVEVWIYASLLFLLQTGWSVGHISGDFQGAFLDYVYFSAVTYTSLGLGDVWPHGPLRFVTGIEALNGLILIGWSVWFTYPIIRRGCQPVREKAQ